MLLVICEDEKIANPTEQDISRALRFLDETSNVAFASLEHDDMNYLLVTGDQRHGFRLEYQSGSTQEHFAALELTAIDHTIRVFVLYLHGDSDWRGLVVWKKGVPPLKRIRAGRP